MSRGGTESYFGASVIVAMVALIVAVIAFIVAVPTLLFSGISSEIIINYLRVIMSGIALGFTIILIKKEKGNIAYHILAIAIGCIFLNDAYNFIHQLLFGDTGRYIVNYLPYLGSLVFISSLNYQFMKKEHLMKKENVKMKLIPLITIIPALILAFFLWLLIGKAFMFPCLYAIILFQSFYTILSVLMTKKTGYIFFELVFLAHSLAAFFIIGNFTDYTGNILIAIAELGATLIPLLYIPALKWGLIKCLES